jgi:uncharacterized membrane protein
MTRVYLLLVCVCGIALGYGLEAVDASWGLSVVAIAVFLAAIYVMSPVRRRRGLERD